MRSTGRAVARIVCVLALSAPAAADELADARHARALSDSLMSPFCPGRTLSDCPSPNATAVREEIRAWVGEGRSDAEIRDLLRTQFGLAVEGEPQSGWGRAAPLAAVALVGLLFAFGVRRVVSRRGDPQ